MFARTLGGAIAVSISQNVFANRLSSALISTVQNLDPGAVLTTGATTIEGIVGTEYTAEAVSALQSALARVFYVGHGTSCLSTIGAIGMEWKTLQL
jgi:hypothetical protein